MARPRQRRGAAPVLREARLYRAFQVFLLLLPLLLAQHGSCMVTPAGKVVWWGKDVLQHRTYSEHTNGVLEIDNEVVDNVIAIAAGRAQVLGLRSDGTVISCGFGLFGWNEVPAGLSNVVSVSVAGNSCWAIKRDGTVVRWGNSDGDDSHVVAGLSNITAVTWAGYRSYLALRRDGTVLGFRLGENGSTDSSALGSAAQQVRVYGHVLTNVAALTPGNDPLMLKRDGTVWRLQYYPSGEPPPEPAVTATGDRTFLIDFRGEFSKTPYEYTCAEPILIGGRPLSNVIAIVDGGGQPLALKGDGTVVALGTNYHGGPAIPAGLNRVTAIAANEHLNLALKSDGTVAAWGANQFGETLVPAGLTNVVAIAAGGLVSFALTTGPLPSSVYTYPQGRLEEMERKADLVFKGRVTSSRAITNTPFPPWGKPHATNGKMQSLLPTLEALFSAPFGPTNPVPPLTLEALQAGGQLGNLRVGDVHTSAGHALLKFDADQVSTFLKANLHDPGFRISFLCKLAEKGAGPWLTDLAGVMESRRTENQRKAETSGAEPQAHYFEALMALSGNYFHCWNRIYGYLHDLPKEQFVTGKMDRYLDVLENAGTTGSREPVMIYELYRMKGLDERAKRFRAQTEQKLGAYRIGQFYDKVDATFTNASPRPAH